MPTLPSTLPQVQRRVRTGFAAGRVDEVFVAGEDVGVAVADDAAHAGRRSRGGLLATDRRGSVLPLPASSKQVFSLCFSRGRLFVQFSPCGEQSGLLWLDPDSCVR